MHTFAVIDLGCGLKAVGPVAQKDPVEVELEYLFLGKTALDFDSQQYLVKFPNKGSIQREELIACHLHG
ncbi:MAG: hypothetical protein ACI9NT_002773, partial [Bacteroidia bacterium]